MKSDSITVWYASNLPPILYLCDRVGIGNQYSLQTHGFILLKTTGCVVIITGLNFNSLLITIHLSLIIVNSMNNQSIFDILNTKDEFICAKLFNHVNLTGLLMLMPHSILSNTVNQCIHHFSKVLLIFYCLTKSLTNP